MKHDKEKLINDNQLLDGWTKSNKKLLLYYTLLFILFHDVYKPWIIEKSCTQHTFISLAHEATELASQYFLKQQERTQIKHSTYHGAQQVWHLDLSKIQ